MKKKVWEKGTLWFLCGAAVIVMTACTTAADSPVEPDEPVIEATTTKDDSSIDVIINREETVVEIISQSGIGGANIELTSGSWSETVLLRFHLQGLEQLQFGFSDILISVYVSSQEGNEVHQSAGNIYVEPNDERAIGPESACWMEVEIVSAEGESGNAIPIKDGFIDVAVPRCFLESGEDQFSISWIDFFR